MLGHAGTPQTPLSRCVLRPLASKKIFGRSRVATVTTSPFLSVTCAPRACASSSRQLCPRAANYCVLQVMGARARFGCGRGLNLRAVRLLRTHVPRVPVRREAAMGARSGDDTSSSHLYHTSRTCAQWHAQALKRKRTCERRPSSPRTRGHTVGAPHCCTRDRSGASLVHPCTGMGPHSRHQGRPRA